MLSCEVIEKMSKIGSFGPPVFRGGIPQILYMHFYRASICEGGLGSRNFVCLSVRLSHAWIVTKLKNGALQIF